MKYTLRQLQVFLTTAHTGNISRAAEQLAMSQSAASSALKDLEQQFDIQLFDRIGKKLQLNELGRMLQPQAEELLERAEELESTLTPTPTKSTWAWACISTTTASCHCWPACRPPKRP